MIKAWGINVPRPRHWKEQFQRWQKRKRKRWTPERKSWAEHGSSYQFNVLFQCALDRVHPSIHPAPFHRSGIPFSPQTVTHGRSGKVSVRKERNRERTLLRWEELRDQTNTWRRLTTQELASPGGEPPDRHFSPSRQGTNVKRDGIKPKLPVGTVKIKALVCYFRRFIFMYAYRSRPRSIVCVIIKGRDSYVNSNSKYLF